MYEFSPIQLSPSSLPPSHFRPQQVQIQRQHSNRHSRETHVVLLTTHQRAPLENYDQMVHDTPYLETNFDLSHYAVYAVVKLWLIFYQYYLGVL